MSDIEWTDETWNPLKGCLRCSPGCLHCYAERQAARPILSGPGKPYEGLVTIGKQGPRWTGATGGPDKLNLPLTWRKPRKVFVCSMSDLFYEGHSNEAIAAVFGVMAACPHTFQVLTKRAGRAVDWFEWVRQHAAQSCTTIGGPRETIFVKWMADRALGRDCADLGLDVSARKGDPTCFEAIPWPLPNVWIGVSVENQEYAEARLPHLLNIPAAVRFVSYEPALGPVDFSRWLQGWEWRPDGLNMCQARQAITQRIDWIIVGGESGPGARPFDLAWARAVVAQCRAAHVPVFVKQMGAVPVSRALNDVMSDGGGLTSALAVELKLHGRKGGDMDEWPADLRVREWPEARR